MMMGRQSWFELSIFANAVAAKFGAAPKISTDLGNQLCFTGPLVEVVSGMNPVNFMADTLCIEKWRRV